ncbi:MAG: hypothetical protein A3J35_02275 [Gammaproteobacteria bacterium RIFCSPLOWO2_02_FULL_52_10]|nr:MAG: hypothetical protein A3J35_02275 [Gammaproteobacteria bacterium RIFCSPLOWO2_02_FULL_52_10]
MPQTSKTTSKTRKEIAQLAAKFVAVDGVNDYLAAKRKAAVQLGIKPDNGLPTNLEVEQALREYQSLFQNQDQAAQLNEMRKKALQAMRFMISYQPRLVGPVLTGTATRHSEITLHLVSDEPEQIGLHLDEHAIPFTTTTKSLKIGKDEKKDFPAFEFIADKTRILLIVFPERQKHCSPLSSITGKPMQRATISTVEKLLS